MRIGTWITVPHPSIVDLMSRQDFDWLCVDLEHSPVDRIDLQTSINIIQLNGKKAFARIQENSHLSAKFPLDCGIDGIIIPMVNSADQARQAVKNCFYPPKGNRGVGLARAQGYGFDFDDHLAKNLKELEVIVQIEHVSAVAEFDDIISIPEVTGVFLGPYDLSGSMGIPGEFEHPRMIKAIEEVAKKTIEANKLLGIHVISPDFEKVVQYGKLGYNFIAFSLDTLFLGQKVREQLMHLKKTETDHG